MSPGQRVDLALGEAHNQQTQGAPKAEVVGYVLADANTYALDWDGQIHGTLNDALAELVRAHEGAFEDREHLGIDAVDLNYLIFEVTAKPSLGVRALEAVRARYEPKVDLGGGMSVPISEVLDVGDLPGGAS